MRQVLALFVVVLALSSCGGSGGTGPILSPPTTATLAVSVNWPAPTRSVPELASEIVIEAFDEQGTKLGNATQKRPPIAQTMISTITVPNGQGYRLQALARSASGVVLGKANLLNVAAEGGKVIDWPVAIQSTIKTIEATDVPGTLGDGESQLISLVARDEDGATVPISPSALQWTVENPSILKVEGSAGQGISDGTLFITGMSPGSTSLVLSNPDSGLTSRYTIEVKDQGNLMFLGSFGGGAAQATAVSADGRCVVGNLSGRPFRWTNEDGLVFLAPSRIGSALGVSGDGSVVVGTFGTTVSEYRGFRWQGGQIEELPPLLQMIGTTARAISEDGNTIVGSSINPKNELYSCRWVRGFGVQPVGKNQPQLLGEGVAVNSNGTRILIDSRLTIWYGPYNAVDHGSPPALLKPNGISEDATIACATLLDETIAYVWDEATRFTSLGYLNPARQVPTRAGAITKDGTKIFGVSDKRLFVWTKSTGMVELDPSIPRTVEMQFVRGISADGSVIVGTAVVNGKEQAFRWSATR